MKLDVEQINLNENDLDKTIWKYMSLSKFNYLLFKSTLYMPAIEQLEDPHELFPPKALQDPNYWKAILVKKGNKTSRTDEFIWRAAESKARDLLNLYEKRDSCRISSWLMADTQKELFWSRYSSLDSGVAIKTTIRKLINSINVKCEGKHPYSSLHIYAAKVIYFSNYNIDFDQYPESLAYLPGLYKRDIFQDENEFRLIYNNPPIHGLDHLEVDLPTLLAEIVISPKAPSTLYDSIKSILSKIGIDEKIITQSDMYKPPIEKPLKKIERIGSAILTFKNNADLNEWLDYIESFGGGLSMSYDSGVVSLDKAVETIWDKRDINKVSTTIKINSDGIVRDVGLPNTTLFDILIKSPKQNFSVMFDLIEWD